MTSSRASQPVSSVPVGGSAPYFDSVADSYFDLYRENTPAGHALRVRRARVLELLNGLTGRVLDVGCGPGIMVRHLTHLGCQVWAVDAAPNMIEQCRKLFGHLPNVHCAVGDATALNFPGDYFDGVVCMGVVDRIREYQIAVKEMLRVLRPGGTLVVTFPNLYSPAAAWRRFVFNPVADTLRPIYFRLRRRQQPPALVSFVKLHTARSAVKLVARYSGDCTDVIYFNFNVFPSPLDHFFPRLTVRVAEMLERQRLGTPRWVGTGFIVKATKKKRPSAHGA